MSEQQETPINQVIEFTMNQWKDIYYKNEYQTSKEWFLIHISDDNPCMYYAEYVDDLPPIDFMIKNRINGYFQELMDVKNFSNIAHGRVIIDGKNIKFIWIFVNTDIPSEMKNSALYPCCSWEKITKEDIKFDTIMFNEPNIEFIDYK